MGTHVAIDEDVVRAAEKLAHDQGRTLGEVISDLARQSLPIEQPITYRNGIPLLPLRNLKNKISMEFVNRLRDEEP